MYKKIAEVQSNLLKTSNSAHGTFSSALTSKVTNEEKKLQEEHEKNEKEKTESSVVKPEEGKKVTTVDVTADKKEDKTTVELDTTVKKE